jgi:hypothetical protein
MAKQSYNCWRSSWYVPSAHSSATDKPSKKLSNSCKGSCWQHQRVPLCSAGASKYSKAIALWCCTQQSSLATHSACICTGNVVICIQSSLTCILLWFINIVSAAGCMMQCIERKDAALQHQHAATNSLGLLSDATSLQASKC